MKNRSILHQSACLHCANAGISIVFAIIAACLLLSQPATADGITFEDSARSAGIDVTGPTAASAWGNLNSDGWPDLWISNHHGRAPSIYLNDREGKFADATDSLFNKSGDQSWPDFHGAAWADVDNDGDHDLLVITGGGAGAGESANSFYINDGNGKLYDEAKSSGLSYSLGRGRTPLWFDANNDGLLDVVLMNKPRDDAPSRLFVQAVDSFGTHPPKFTPGKALQVLNTAKQDERSLGWWQDLIETVRIWFSPPPALPSAAGEFAQIGNLFAHKNPPKEPSTEQQPVPASIVLYRKTIEASLWRDSSAPDQVGQLPSTSMVLDAAIGDFNNDLRNDWLVVRARPWAREIRAPNEKQLLTSIAGNPARPHSFSFESAGNLTVTFHRPWIDPSDPRIAENIKFYKGDNLEPLPKSVTLTSNDPAIATAHEHAGKYLGVSRDSTSGRWHFTNSTGPINLVIDATENIQNLKTNGFKSSQGQESSQVFLSGPNGLYEIPAQEMSPKPCVSVAAGDFDNDGDLDAYAVCSSATHNSPDVIWVNNGRGKFTEKSVEGTSSGRGNQVAVADYDRDGSLDLLITNGEGPPPYSNNGPVQLLRNTTNNANHWLQIDLVGTQSNRDGIGAKVTITTATAKQVRTQNGGVHSFSQDQMRLHFGLAKQTTVNQIEVLWPSGTKQMLGPITGDQLLTITEPATSSTRSAGSRQ